MRLLVFFLFIGSLWGDIAKTTFLLTTDPIDVVIPCAPKDLRTLDFCIEGIKKNGANLRRIIVVSREKLTDKAEWFQEEAYPFSKEDLALEIFRGDAEAAYQFIHRPDTRIGWVFQQFLKLYAPFVIPDLSPNVLILDADVIFFRPISFMDGQGEPYFTPADEYHGPYFAHGERLISGWRRVHPRISGIAHHMLFQKPILEDLFDVIRQEHQMEPWKAICQATDLEDIQFSGISEYELYFNYARLRTWQGTIRPLRWTLSSSTRYLPALERSGYTFVCFPTWQAE